MKRVVQWATGNVGRHALAAIVDHPDLELVGTFVYSAAKTGLDAGDVGGIGPVGVRCTADRDEILALDADCVLYAAQGEMNPFGALDDICALLVSGKNVVSTAVTPLIYPPSMGRKVVARLEEACAIGDVSFHATGIEPGWASEVLPLTMSGVFRYVESLVVQEILDYATYDSRDMLFDIMGFGCAPDADVPGSNPAVLGSVFRAPLLMLAEAFGATIDEIVFDRSVWLAEQPFDVAAGHVEIGTVAAQRFSATAIVEGRRALTVEHITRLDESNAPDWPRGRGWKVTIAGVPSMVLEAKIAVNGEDENDQGCLATAMHAVHAIVPVCNAAAGIRTFLDLPTIVGRHVLRRPEHLRRPAIASPAEPDRNL